MAFRGRVKRPSKGEMLRKQDQIIKERDSMLMTLKLILYHKLPDRTVTLTDDERHVDTRGMALQVALDPDTQLYTLRLTTVDDILDGESND